MSKLYSANRRGRYVTGQPLGLFQQPTQGPLSDQPGFSSVPDLSAHLRALFPTGLSLHGWDYLTAQHLVQGGVGTSIALELLFEYVRRVHFPERASRLQSYFAFDDLHLTLGFRGMNRSWGIFELSSAQVERLDMTWLNMGVQGAQAYYNAHQYWSGAATSDPIWEHLLAPMVQVGPQVA